MTKLLGVSDFGFQWSTDEQVWPFEKTRNGETIYCKEVDFGIGPNGTNKTVAHNIPNFEATDDLFRVEILTVNDIPGNEAYMLPDIGVVVTSYITPTVCYVGTSGNLSGYTLTFRLWYKK